MSDSSEVIGRVLDGRYRLVAFLGAGRFTHVYLADDTSQPRQVAVKLLAAEVQPDGWDADGDFVRRYLEAAEEASAVTHKHVAATYGWGDSDIGPYVVGEYLEGGSLKQMLSAEHVLTPSQTLMVGLEVARGLEHIHRKGLVHCDVRPSNILFDGQGQARLADVGTSLALSTRSAFSALDAARYSSPEQAHGLSLDRKSDVYSLALVLAEALSGRVPFDSDDPEYIQMAKMSRGLDLAGEFDRLGRVLESAALPDRQGRPSAGELAKALLAAAGTLPRPAPLPLSKVEPAVLQPRAPESSVPEPSLPEPEAASAPVSGAPATGPPETGLAPPPAPAGVAAQTPTATGPPAPDLAAPAAPAPVASPSGSAEAGSRPDRPLWLRLLPVAALVLLSAAGFGAYALWNALASGENQPVPNLLGAADTELYRIEDEFGWVLDRLELRRNGTVAGQVLGQAPGPGTRLAKGETVTVWVSLGPERVVVPSNLVGLAVQDAEASLAAVGLSVGEVSRRYDEAFIEGLIVEVDELFLEVEPGASVDLVVSLGPEPRVVPEIVVGTSLAAAQEWLEELRLIMLERRVTDNEVEADHVVSVEPPPGSEVAADSVVTVVVSDGPERVRVPEVTTFGVDEATEAFEAVGLCLGEVEGSLDTEILSSRPPVDALVDIGSCVDLITRP